MSRSTVLLIVAVWSISAIVFGIRDAFTFDGAQWSAAGRNRAAWIALMVGFGPLAVLLYWGTVRYDLKDPHRLT